MKTRENFYSGYKDQHAMDDATLKLIEENADHLIDYLYNYLIDYLYKIIYMILEIKIVFLEIPKFVLD